MAKASLSRVSTQELRRELERRATQIESLGGRRHKLQEELSRVDAEIAALGGTNLSIKSATKRRRGRVARRGARSPAAETRAANSMTLTEALSRSLKGKTMSVGEVADAVQAAGYKTNAANFRTIVNLTLIKRKDLFKKRGRGQYTAK